MVIDKIREPQVKKKKERVLREQSQYQSVSCEVCLKAFPESCSCPREVSDYVMYYCGVECYVEWEPKDE